MNPNDKSKPTPNAPKPSTLLEKIKDVVTTHVKAGDKNMVRAVIQVQMPNQLYKAGDIFEVKEIDTLNYLLNAKAVERVQ